MFPVTASFSAAALRFELIPRDSQAFVKHHAAFKLRRPTVVPCCRSFTDSIIHFQSPYWCRLPIVRRRECSTTAPGGRRPVRLRDAHACNFCAGAAAARLWVQCSRERAGYTGSYLLVFPGSLNRALSNGIQGYESGRLYTFNLTEPPGLTPIYYAGKQRAFVKTATPHPSDYSRSNRLRLRCGFLLNPSSVL